MLKYADNHFPLICLYFILIVRTNGKYVNLIFFFYFLNRNVCQFTACFRCFFLWSTIHDMKQIRLHTSMYTVCDYRIISHAGISYLAKELCKLYLHSSNRWQYFRQLLLLLDPAESRQLSQSFWFLFNSEYYITTYIV